IERIGCPVWRRFRVDHFPNTQEPKIAHRGQQESHLQHMVAAGLGIMIAPEHAPCLPSLIARPLAEDTVWREVHMLVVSGRRRSPALDAFIKALRLRDWKQAQGAVRARGSARRPPRPAEAGTASAAEDSAGENECGDCSTGTTPT
ncbi:MAG: LysR family transcriptional regulator substrate-binding protein, partial [Bradyrhizobiaceae bacterium]|nr:LysR family transcriptional regulator substrate-binding protein [Bradyrhizobiaceae bacterium]